MSLQGPESNEVEKKIENGKEFDETLKKINKLNNFISLDTRKSWIMEKGINYKVNLINDVSGLNHDPQYNKYSEKNKYPICNTSYARNPKNHAKKSKI